MDGTGNVEQRILWGPAVDQVFADENALDEVFWMLTDNQNTVRDAVEYNAGTDTTSVANHIAYNSFGEKQSETNAALDVLPLNYTARYLDPLTGLQWNLNRWYDPTTGHWLSEDPIGFAAGDDNLSRYAGNSPANATDPAGLKKLGLSDLEQALKGIAQSQGAKNEAAAIAAVINYTWSLNSKWNWAALSINNQKAKGYYCYEWAYGFQDAAESQSSGKYFTVSVEVFGDSKSGRVHAFTTITSLETGKSIYVDDGFMGLGQVHTTRPIRGIYKTPIDLVAELDRDNCDVPRVISAEEYAKFWEQVTAAMDATMH